MKQGNADTGTGEETLPKEFDIRIEHGDINNTRNHPTSTIQSTNPIEDARFIEVDRSKTIDQPSRDDEMFTTDHGFKELGKSSKNAADNIESSNSQQADDIGAFLTSIPVDVQKSKKKKIEVSKHQEEESDDELRDLKEISQKNAENYVRYLMEGKVKLPQEKKVAVTKEVAGNFDH